MACRDIEKNDLIGFLFVIKLGDLDRVSGIPQVHEIRALDDTAVFDIQTGNYPFREHNAKASFRSSLPS